MASPVVLVTGIATQLGGRLAARLATDPTIGRVLGADLRRPTTVPDGVEFVRADQNGDRIATVLRSASVDVVVHAEPRPSRGRPAVRERNVLGTLRLLAGCQRAQTVRKLVVRSTAEVYGASPTSPAVFTEQDVLGRRRGRDRDFAEVEGYLREFARRRPEVTVTTVRFAELIGPALDSALARYFALPVVPTALGFDARVQLLHEQDAVAVLHRAVTHDLPGVFNVGGDGVLLLSQAIRRAGRLPLPVPRAAVPAAARLARTELSPDLARLLSYGRVLDTTRLKTTFGYTPRWSTPAAFDDYVQGYGREHRPEPSTEPSTERSTEHVTQ